MTSREENRVLSDKVLNFKGDSKKLYRFVSELFGTKTETPMTEVWNKLSIHFKQSKLIDDFKSKLKFYFFRDFYALF